MKITTETIEGQVIHVVSSDFLHMVSQGKSMEEALDNFDVMLHGAVMLSKTKGIENCLNFKEVKHARTT